MELQGNFTEIAKRKCCNKFLKMDSEGKRQKWNNSFVIWALLCFVPLVSCQPNNAVEMKIPLAGEPLTLLWGIADTTAYIGKLFTYTLPSDAFQGNIVHYDITEVSTATLPSWLTFNPLKTELKGIPGPENKGQIYLEVKVTGDDNSKADDVFSIEVLDDTNGQVTNVQVTSDNAPKVVNCPRDGPQTVATVVVDLDLVQMSPSEKVGLLENMGNHLNIAPEVLKLMPVGNKPMFDSSALVVGPGNVKEPKTAGALVSWLVGCGQVEQDHLNLLQQVESAAANGDMTSAVGHGIIGYHVTNTRFQAKPRKKRAVTPTPTLTPPAPTTVVATSSSKILSTSSVSIKPTKSAEVLPTKMPDTKTATKTTTATLIQPSETIKMTKSSSVKATEILPTKTYTMTSSSTTQTKLMPSSTTTTTSSTVTTKATTPTPTTPKPTTKTTPKPTTKTTPKPTTPAPVLTPEPLCPPRGEKKAPRITNDVEDFSVPAGSVNKKRLPEDTFTDCYDTSTSDLRLELTFSNGRPISREYWIQLNQRLNKPYQLIMNPLNNDAGSYNFTLIATNSYEKSTSTNFVIVVEGMEEAESQPNHELSMTIDANYDDFMSDLENRIELSNKISKIFGDRNSNSVAVTRLEEGSVVYAWTNSSLASDDCPTNDLKALVDKMFNKDGTLTQNALDEMQPYKINSAESKPLGACTNNPSFPSRSTKAVQKTTSKPEMPTTMKPTDAEKPKETEKVTKATDKMPSTDQPTIKYSDKPKTTEDAKTESTTVAVAAAGAGSGGSNIWITTVVPAIVVVIVLIIALIIACCLYRKRRKGKMKLEEKNKFANNKGVPVIFADEYEEKPNDSKRPLIMDEEKPPMPPPGYQRASSETSGNSNSTQPMEAEEIEMEDTSEMSPLYSPPPPVTASNNSKPPHVQSSRGPPPYVPP